MMNGAPFSNAILSGAIAAGTLGVQNCLGYPYLTAYVVGTGVTSSGVVTLEEAPTEDHAGTWASIGTVNASGATGGACVISALTVRSYAFVRARISTVIGGGGSITVTLVGAPSA